MKKFALSSLLITSLAAVLSCGQAANAALVNPGFEQASTAGGDVANVPGWNVFGNGFTTGVAARTGSNALKLFGGNDGVFQDMAVAGGQSVTASAFGLNFTDDPLLGTQIGAINIEFFNGATQLNVAFGPQVTSTTPRGTTAADYVPLSITATAPANTTSARLVLITGPYGTAAGNPGGSVRFDDASFVINGVPEPTSLALLGGLGLLGLGRRSR